jgi:hypothetical protein
VTAGIWLQSNTTTGASPRNASAEGCLTAQQPFRGSAERTNTLAWQRERQNKFAGVIVIRQSRSASATMLSAQAWCQILRDMLDDLQRVSDALDIPLAWLLGVLLAGFAMLLVAMGAHNWTVSGVAAAFGVVFSLIGVRATLRPSRPFRLESVQNTPGINTTRRVGLFYIAAGLIWAMIALLVAKGS